LTKIYLKGCLFKDHWKQLESKNHNMLFGHNWLVGLPFVIKFFSQKIIAQESGEISKITLHVLKAARTERLKSKKFA
jgi:hypothetical protein